MDEIIKSNINKRRKKEEINTIECEINGINAGGEN